MPVASGLKLFSSLISIAFVPSPRSWRLGLLSKDTISLEQNNLKGGIPHSLLAVAKRLRHLRLSNNEFEGGLPSILGQLTNLKEVALDGNSFTGSVPASWGSLTQLQSLELFGNTLTGSVPDEVCAISKDALKVTADCDTGSVTCDCCEKCY
jgi:Leucine rich repeat